MAKYAKVLVDVSAEKTFDYLIPAGLSDRIAVGSRVVVPFGKRTTVGYVADLPEHSDFPGLKEVIAVEGEKPYLSRTMLQLADWISAYYCATREQTMRTILPGAVRRKGAGFKKRMMVSLAADAQPDGIKEHAGTKVAVTGKQKKLLDIVSARGPVLFQDLLREAGVTAGVLNVLKKKELVRVEPAEIRREPDSVRNILPTKPLSLMKEQAEALAMIVSAVDDAQRTQGAERMAQGGEPALHNAQDGMCLSGKESASSAQQPRVVLLYGVTGSGKTEVYLQAIDYVLGKGKSAIILVPEISLTPQTVERFVSRFGENVAVLHSHLSEGERHDEWHRVCSGKARIVVGARSAVFAPCENLGLIVVDEEHEPSYKQEEAPRYSARDVAVMRGNLENCPVVLGSATPCLESWHNVRKGKYLLAKLPRRADNRRMPAMRVVDMRLQSKEKGQGGILSGELFEAVKSRLERSEQTILFLNRRGFATSLICPNCGFVAKCDMCSVCQTYHRTDEILRCHICGGTRKVPDKCPSCHDPSFKYSGVGTQRVETIVGKCFPHAKVQRMDTDMTRTKDSYQRILGDFRSGRIDILIGTQMIAKGLHFPNVTLVGVVYADLSIHMPDFRAGERTFQLLAQVAGRAGRGEVAGEVIVQTYTPSHVAVQAARRLDYEGFCDQELEFRKQLQYPPFSHLVCILFKGHSETKVSFSASAFHRKLSSGCGHGTIVSKPCPAPLARAKGLFRYQIMVRCKSMKSLCRVYGETMRSMRMPEGVTCSIDVDALSLM